MKLFYVFHYVSRIFILRPGPEGKVSAAAICYV